MANLSDIILQAAQQEANRRNSERIGNILPGFLNDLNTIQEQNRARKTISDIFGQQQLTQPPLAPSPAPGITTGPQKPIITGGLPKGLEPFGPLRLSEAKELASLLKSTAPAPPGYIFNPVTGELQVVPAHTQQLQTPGVQQQPGRVLTKEEQESYGVPSGTTMAQVKGEVPVQPQQRLALAEFEKVKPMLQEIENNLNRVGLENNIKDAAISGAAKTAKSLVPGTEENIFRSTINGFLSQITRASGEKGVLTDTDVKRIRQALPTFFDTDYSAKRKLDTLKSIYSDVRNRQTSALKGPVQSGTQEQTTPAAPTLPTDLPTNNLFEGRRIRDTQDNKIYRVTNGNWQPE